MICRIARFNIESDVHQMHQLWAIADDAEVIQGSDAPALGVGTYQWYRVYFSTVHKEAEAINLGLITPRPIDQVPPQFAAFGDYNLDHTVKQGS